MNNEEKNTETNVSTSVGGGSAASAIADAIKKYRPTSGSGSSESGMKKLLIIIIVLTIILVILLAIFSGASKPKKGITYSDREDLMSDAARKFFSANKKYLPKTNGGTVEISAQKLINESYLDANYAPSTCTGKVVVQNNDDSFIYIPYLDCGSAYKTTQFYRKITENKNIVTSGNGLYNEDGTYVFKGDTVNNHVELGHATWRIVKVTSDNEVVLALDKFDNNYNPYTTYPWDDRLNADRDTDSASGSGINNFNISRIKDSIKTYLDTPLGDGTERLIDKNIRGHIVDHQYCIGKRGYDDGTKNMSVECSEVSEPLEVGLLTVSEFMDASLDGNCNRTVSDLCQNYNYLNETGYNWWTITADGTNSYRAYYVSSNGSVSSSPASTYRNIRPVIYLDSKTMFKSGNGTEDKPYKIK